MKLFICKDLFRMLVRKDLNDKANNFIEIDTDEFAEHLNNCDYCSKYFADLITDALVKNPLTFLKGLKK